ncbi:MAG: hypothetical protein IKO72_01675 [Kiritimatiellae bacterium]|nr:hypothetical protein [Kiritimatiellia bacterium]
MKKLMSIAVAMAAGIVLATDGIESQNTVGYASLNVSAGQIIGLGIQFNDTATENTIAVKDLVTVDVPAGANALGDTADQIWKWENNAWTKYFYRKRGATTYGWVKYDSSASTQPSVETSDTLGNGESVFFKRATGAGGASLTLAGAVNLQAATVSTDVAAGQIVQLANPWPTVFPVVNIADCIPAADQAGANALGDTADQIWVWENNAWTKYFYRKRGATTYGWVKYDSAASSQPTTPTTDTIGIGQGFFFKRATGAGGTTVTFTKPASF